MPKDAKEMTNDEIHAEISSLNTRIAELKANIKPVTMPKAPPLHELNKSAMVQRQEKFKKAQEMNEAVKMMASKAQDVRKPQTKKTT